MIDLQEVLNRFWTDLMARPNGPYSFRFVLQPVTALILAVFDGIKDARAGRTPYLWTIISNPAKRMGRLKEGVKATSRILALGLIMELLYQYKVFGTFYINEAVVVIIVCAFLPYLVFRGIVDRIARRWIDAKKNKA